MKLFHGILASMTLFFLAISSTQAQNQKILEYEFDKQAWKGIIPFDQAFDIRVVRIPAEVTNIYVEIYEIKKQDYKKLSKKLGRPTIRTEDLQGVPNFVSDALPRGSFRGDTAFIPIGAYLEPNSKYLIYVKGKAKAGPIPAITKTLIANAVAADQRFIDLLNEEISQQLLDPTRSSRPLPGLSKQITLIADDVAKRFNKDYGADESVNKGQFKAFARLMTQFSVLGSKINVILGAAHQQIAEDEKAKVADLQQQIDAIDKITDGTLKAQKASELADLKRKKEEATNFINQQEDLSRFYNAEDANTFRANANLYKELSTYNWALMKKDDTQYKKILGVIESELRSKKYANISDATAKKIQDDITTRIPTIQTALDQALALVAKTVDEIKVQVEETLFAFGQVNSSYPADAQEHIKLHVTLDLGYAYVANIDRTNLYAGMNIYFRGIDTSLPLKNYRRTWKDFIGARTSLLIGISMQSIARDSVRKGVIGNGLALITGVGFRLLPWFKVNGGTYWYYKYPNNPLINKGQYSFTASPFVSLSIDFNLKSFISSFGNGKVAQIFTP